MLVDNIFKLVNKFGAKEDQLSANFGFILKNNNKILGKFLKKIGIIAKRKDLKQIDIETQVAYDSGKSRIDLQLIIPNQCLIFLESKITAIKPDINVIFNQLKKYRQILEDKKLEYDKIKLVYVGKDPITKKELSSLKKKLKLKNDEFFFFSWEYLLNLTEEFKQKELIKLFNNYIGDSMYNKKIIKEQMIKKIPEVLCIFTHPDFWELSEKKNIAVQKKSTPDAQYIAFLRIKLKRGKGVTSAITHIARVNSTEIVPLKEVFSGLPKLLKRAREENNLQVAVKRYNLEKIEKLANEIVHDSNKGRVNFKTTSGELLHARSTKEIHVKF